MNKLFSVVADKYVKMEQSKKLYHVEERNTFSYYKSKGNKTESFLFP